MWTGSCNSLSWFPLTSDWSWLAWDLSWCSSNFLWSLLDEGIASFWHVLWTHQCYIFTVLFILENCHFQFSNFVLKWLDCFVLVFNAWFERAILSYQILIGLVDLVVLKILWLWVSKSLIQHWNLIGFLLKFVMHSLWFFQDLIIFLWFRLQLLHFLLQLILLFFLVHNCYLKLILVISLHVELILLSIKCLLQSDLIILCCIILVDKIVLLLCQSFILDHGLFKDSPETHALFNIGLNINFRLFVFAHLDISLQLFNLSILLFTLLLQIAVLFLQLLNQKWLKIVSFLAHWHSTTSWEIVCLLLKLSCQVFNIFLLLGQVYVHLGWSCAQSHILILGDVVLNFQISVHVFQFLTFLLFKYWCLICLANILLLISLDLTLGTLVL